MARSPRLRALESRLTQLRRHFLPRTFSPTGQYTDRQYDQARGYRLLAHAEIEACIEDLVADLVTTAYKAWQTDRRPRACIIALLAYHGESLGPVPEGISTRPGGASETPLRVRVDIARKVYVNHVRQPNNGVREKDVLKLLLPVGILESDLNSAWLQTIDSFGDLRGTTAHQALKTQQPLDPAQELRMVTEIVTGLRAIDEKLQNLA